MPGEDDVADFCERVVTVPRRLASSLAGVLRRGFSALPLQTALYETGEMRRAIRQTLSGGSFDVAHVQLARMGPYLDDVCALPRVLDFVDALSLNMRRRCESDRGLWRWVACLEARRLGPYEQRLCRAVDRALVGSALDREAMGAPPGLAVVTSGVDLVEFAYQRAGRSADTVVFSGHMSYFPNVQAAVWFGRSVLPRVRAAVPGVRFHVVGAHPARAIRRLPRDHARIEVSGFVDSLSSHLRRAAVAVAPMRAGSGQPLKILEAMASGTPVVATALAARGLEARPGEHLLVADDPPAFAEGVVRLLRDRDLAEALAANARRLVEARYTWEHSVAQLEAIYRSAIERRATPSGGTS